MVQRRKKLIFNFGVAVQFLFSAQSILGKIEDPQINQLAFNRETYSLYKKVIKFLTFTAGRIVKKKNKKMCSSPVQALMSPGSLETTGHFIPFIFMEWRNLVRLTLFSSHFTPNAGKGQIGISSNYCGFYLYIFLLNGAFIESAQCKCLNFCAHLWAPPLRAGNFSL